MSEASWLDFGGKCVMITGGGGAIGRELALAFARHGAKLVLVDADREKLAATRVEIERLGPPVMAELLDVRDAAGVEAVVEASWQRFGGIDVLVNTAAVFDRGPSTEFPEARYDRVLDINLKGTWLMCQAVGRRMLERGHGRIINYASNAGIRGTGEQVAYNVSKAGVIVLTKSLAVEWARRGITVNAVSPGPTETPLLTAVFDQETMKNAFAPRIPMGELTPVDVTVGPVLFLASDAARWITGHTLFADGGMSAL